MNSRTNNGKTEYSVSPENEKFMIPQEYQYAAEYDRLEKMVNQARSEGKEIVVVMGVGFVGAVMAAIVADTQNESGQDSKFVIGCQRPSTRSYWKIELLNRGQSPFNRPLCAGEENAHRHL
jgi:UDP-N-acetyl-D-glucosamine dehydrogenase